MNYRTPRSRGTARMRQIVVLNQMLAPLESIQLMRQCIVVDSGMTSSFVPPSHSTILDASRKCLPILGKMQYWRLDDELGVELSRRMGRVLD